METPKLETVPEETEAQPVSRPTNKHIHSDVPKTVPAKAKHPGRVASGKRLAERNRVAKEARKQAKAAGAAPSPDTSPEPTPTTSSDSSGSSDSNTSGYTILAVGGLLVSAMGVYYQREAIMKTLKRKDTPDPPAPPEPKGEEFKDLPTAIHSTLRPRMPVPKRKSGIREME